MHPDGPEELLITADDSGMLASKVGTRPQTGGGIVRGLLRGTDRGTWTGIDLRSPIGAQIWITWSP
eukprot:5980425-Alexandrium_andersonii.AAC.1